LLTLAFPHGEEVRDVPLIVLAMIAYVIAGLVWFGAELVREWQIHVVLAAGTAIISLANYYAGPSTLYPLLYVWTALYAFYFFPLREAAAQMAFLAVSYAVVLAVQDVGMVVGSWLLAVGTPLLAGLLISQLLTLLQRQARDLFQSEERTRLVLDSAPDAFITLDREGYITARCSCPASSRT
jgi:PAS domain-containing protein